MSGSPEYVPQRETWDCGVACLAMVAGVPYEDALAVLSNREYAETNGGIPTVWMPCLLGALGLATRTTFVTMGQQWHAGLSGLRLADVSGHYIVILPDDTVLDPAQRGTDLSYYPQGFHCWEIHRVPSRAAPGGPHDG